jgi:hypothetical protein
VKAGPAIAFLLVMVVTVAACSGPESIAIPTGNVPQRAETYDDIVVCGPGSVDYRANCEPGLDTKSDSVKEIKVILSKGIFAPTVEYRDCIDSKAGQIRYNIFYVSLTNGVMRVISNCTHLLTGSPIVDYDIELTKAVSAIPVTKIGEHGTGYSTPFGDKQIDLRLEIPSRLKPGDYTLNFALLANGLYCGKLPCVIHVVE